MNPSNQDPTPPDEPPTQILGAAPPPPVTPPAPESDWDVAAGEPSEWDALPEASNRFNLVRLLGRGGMGVVQLAEEPLLGRQVALKRLHPHVTDGEGAARLLLEARAVARLNHPNIVRLLEAVRFHGRPCLVLEYVPGRHLYSLVAGRPQDARQSATLVAQLADAVAHAHAAGVVHRDIKSGNVLLARPDAPLGEAGAKLADFGLAKRAGLGGETLDGQVMGTPGYLAPEQAEGRSDLVGPPADIFALGGVLYELLTGRVPFHAANAAEAVQLARIAEPVPVRQLRPGLPRDLETICQKCLERDPLRRYASAADLAEDLRRFLDGRPIVARPVGPVTAALKWAKRRPAAAALLGSVAAGLAVTIALLALLLNEADARAADAADADARSRLELTRSLLYAGGSRGGRGDADGALRDFARVLRLTDELRAAGRADRVAPGARDRLERGARLGASAFSRWETLRPAGELPLPAPASAVAYSPDGRLAATACAGLIRVFDAETLSPVRQFEVAGVTPVRLRFSRDSARLLALEDPARATGWEVATGRMLFRLPVQPFEARRGLSHLGFWSADASRVYLQSGPGVLVAHAADGGAALPLPALSPNDHAVTAADLSPSGEWVVVGNESAEVIWCRTSDHAAVRGSKLGDSPVMGVRCSPDGRHAIAVCQQPPNRATERLPPGERDMYRPCECWLIDATTMARGEFITPTGGIADVAFSPDGSRFALAAAVFASELSLPKGGLFLGQLSPSSEEFATAPMMRLYSAFQAPVRSAAFTRDGECVLAGGLEARAHLVYFGTGETVGTRAADGPIRQVAARPGSWEALAADAGGRAAVLASSPVLSSGVEYDTRGLVRGLVYGADGTILVPVDGRGASGTVLRAWGPADGPPAVAPGPRFRTRRIQALGERIALGSAADAEWAVLDPRSGKPAFPVPASWNAVALLDAGVDEVWLATGGAEPRLQRRRLGSDDSPVEDIEMPPGTGPAALAPLSDGLVLYTRREANRVVCVIHGPVPRSLEIPGRAAGVAAHPSRDALAVSRPSGAVELWDIAGPEPALTGEPLSTRTPADLLVWSPDGVVLALGQSGTGEAELADPWAGVKLTPTLLMRDGLPAIAFRPDGREFAYSHGTRVNRYRVPTPAAGSNAEVAARFEALAAAERVAFRVPPDPPPASVRRCFLLDWQEEANYTPLRPVVPHERLPTPRDAP